MRYIRFTSILVVLSFLPGFGLPAFSQQTWVRTYGVGIGYSVHQTKDGGYIVGGITYPPKSYIHIYLIKTNASGDTLWTRIYGGSKEDYGLSVQQTSDDGYIITGWTFSFGKSQRLYLIKTNSFGDTLWTKTYGDTGYIVGHSVRQTTDGGYIVAGWNQGNLYLIKTNNVGDTLWTKTYRIEDDGTGWSVQEISDGGYIVVGSTHSLGGSYHVFLVKTNPFGDTLWVKTYGSEENEWGNSVQQTTDGGYIVAGNNGTLPPYQVTLRKTDAAGAILWAKTYGGTVGDRGQSVQQTTDGGYIVAGRTSVGVANTDVYLVKTNASGDTLWTRTYGGAGRDEGYSVQQTMDGGYIVAGISNGKVYLIKTDASGNVGRMVKKAGR